MRHLNFLATLAQGRYHFQYEDLITVMRSGCTQRLIQNYSLREESKQIFSRSTPRSRFSLAPPAPARVPPPCRRTRLTQECDLLVIQIITAF